MRGLFIDIDYSAGGLESRLLDPATRSELGGGAFAINKRLFKPVREFSLKSWDKLFRDQMENIRNEIHSGRITGVFWLDGGQYGEIKEPIFIGEADGQRTEFPMPVDNCFAPSWKIYINGVLNTSWTMAEESGVLIFSTAPTGRVTGTGKRKFRVIIIDDSDSILAENQVYTNKTGDGVYSQTAIKLLEVEAVNVE